MVSKGMNGAYAAASVAADATTEAMAQVVFLAFGLGWGSPSSVTWKAPPFDPGCCCCWRFLPSRC